MELNAEKILQAQDIAPPQQVDVPEWGGHVYVRIMTGAERDRWEMKASREMQGQTSQVNIRASLVAMCACDATGKRIFTDNQTANLGAKSAIALNRVFEVAQKINALTEDDIKELEGN